MGSNILSVTEIIKKTPKVSVCVVTYNQDKYIRQCLQSIVDQVTDFDFEVIVGDDCSTDGTREIIRSFTDKYDGIVKSQFHERNVGPAFNYKSVHDDAIGEYVAHCDGDDYWLPGKLQHQADLLDKNMSAAQSWTCAKIVDDNGREIGVFPSHLGRLINPKIVTARHIALSYALVGQHSTQMYRRMFKVDFDPLEPVLDYWIAFNVALNGPAIYSKDILSVYRITKTQSLTRNDKKKRLTVDVLCLHLHTIWIRFPEYSKEAIANFTVRYLMSVIRGHDITSLRVLKRQVRKERLGIFLFTRSFFYFVAQKLF